MIAIVTVTVVVVVISAVAVVAVVPLIGPSVVTTEAIQSRYRGLTLR
jgi:hypothetical protein